jgi:hypothetical protein
MSYMRASKVNTGDPSFLGPYYDPSMLNIPEQSPLTPRNLQRSKNTGGDIPQLSQQSLQPTKTVKNIAGSKFKSNTGIYMPD